MDFYEQFLVNAVTGWLEAHKADMARIQRVRVYLVKLQTALNDVLAAVPEETPATPAP